MWDVIKEIFSSIDGSDIAYLIIGAITGGVVSVRYTLRAQRPRLVIAGHGAGGNSETRTWRIGITNKPSFLGQNLDGESARDVIAHMRLDEKTQRRSYLLYWQNETGQRITIEPGNRKELILFHWMKETKGYCIVDANKEPAARFQDRELNFILTLRDRLEREKSLNSESFSMILI